MSPNSLFSVLNTCAEIKHINQEVGNQLLVKWNTRNVVQIACSK